jgi:hypothetical protein
MKVLLLLLIVGFGTDVLALFVLMGSRWAPWLMHFYIFVQMGITILIISIWQESRKVKNILKVLFGCYIVFWLYAKFTFEPLSGPYYLTGSISSVILALCAGYTLFIVIGDRVQPLLSDSRFWVLLSFVLYYICTLLPVALQSVLFSRSTNMLFLAWNITWVATIASNLIYTIGFLCPQTQT